MIEVLFQVRKDKFKDHPAIPEELDLVEEEEQITHYLMLDEVTWRRRGRSSGAASSVLIGTSLSNWYGRTPPRRVAGL